MKSVLSICLITALATLSADGFCDKKANKKAAVEFKKGIDFYKSGNMEEAVKAFRRAEALKSSWKLQYNIGQCEASLRRFGLAIEAFELYLGEGGDDVLLERRDEVLKELDRLRRMVGTISIKGEPGVDIFVDTLKRGNTSVQSAIKVTAGVEHEISFFKDGRKLGSVTLVVSGGEVVVLPVDPKKPTTVTVAPPAPLTPSPPAAKPAAPAVSKKPAPPPPQQPTYTNMRQLKDALRQRRITKAEYSRHQAVIRKKRQVEFDALKRDLRARKITEREYKKRIVEVKKKYEGN
jgi:tetratricopeptide (TPR) repeat protein